MTDRTFRRILLGITAAGVTSTAAITCYTFYLYRHVSILTIIANGF